MENMILKRQENFIDLTKSQFDSTDMSFNKSFNSKNQLINNNRKSSIKALTFSLKDNSENSNKNIHNLNHRIPFSSMYIIIYGFDVIFFPDSTLFIN